ncbi:MAG: acyltransferase, partial [Pseudomonas sp.]
MKNSNYKFRKDINGLRAWAVVAVVLFHFGVAGFAGGFVGVDVFFVISGFLMTGIILRGLETSTAAAQGGVYGARRFSIIAFYLSRARRILPALLVLCLVLMVVGWFVLPATDYRQLGKHAVSALGFVSNILFWREDGYFDAASHDKLLLHTWSLSVEWQFYLLLPVFMALVWKWRPRRGVQAVALGSLLLLSLLLCVLATPIKATAAFYLLPTRAWEMLAGCLVYLLSLRLVLAPAAQRLLEAAGFALLIAAIALLDSDQQWPGWRALLPVLATVLILVAARQQSLWTSSRLAQWLGNNSYSLYL